MGNLFIATLTSATRRMILEVEEPICSGTTTTATLQGITDSADF